MCDTNNNNNYSLLFCRLTVIAVIISYGIFDVKNQHRVDATTVDNDNRRKQRLVPRFLNGHYVTWPADDHGGTKSRCDADAPPPKPPHAYYTPDNVVFTRMQMAGDRAFVVSPRYKPGVPYTLGYVPLTDCASTSADFNNITNAEHNPKNADGYHSVSPYPSLGAHCQFSKYSTQYKENVNLCDSEGLVNVVDVFLGPDGILWILDIGIAHTLTSPDRASKPKKYHDPKVLGIDVNTGITVHKIMLGKLMKPVTAFDKKIKIIARSLCTIVVEYDDNDNQDTETTTVKNTETGDNGMTKKVIRDKRSANNKLEDGASDGDTSSGIRRKRSSDCSKICSSCADDDVNDNDDTPIVRHRRHSNDESSASKPKPVAVYVGDACTDGQVKGLVLVWLVNDCRGVRVILPTSVWTMGPGGDDDDSCKGDLNPCRNTLHMALLDDFSGQQRRRHLYITYGRHPDAFRIPVTAFRDHVRCSNAAKRPDDLKLTSCSASTTGSNRGCVMNVGRKPISGGGGGVGRPLVPVDSAFGVQWFFRDPAPLRRSDLYVWDARRTFHPEYFEMLVRGHVSTAGLRRTRRRAARGTGCGSPPHLICEKDVGRGKSTGSGKDLESGKDGGCCNDEYCEGYSNVGGGLDKNETDAGQKRPGRLSPGCMEITSVDYSTTEPSGAAASGYELWALHTNMQDWVRGQTGHFGMTALLCPIVCNTADD